MIRKREIFCWGRAAVSRLSGYLALLFLAGGAFTLPLSAEEITVTVPPDPPAQTETSAAPAAQQPTLPSFTDGNSAPAPMAQDMTSPPPETQQEAAPPTPPQPEPSQATESAPAAPVAPEAPKHQAKAKKATAPAAAPGATGASETPARATAAPAKPKAKKASAAATCKGLDENACGGNKACIWVVGTPAEGSSKGTKAGCRSLAAMKKEAKKADKAAKSGEPEVLPWASHTSSAPQSGAGAAPTSDEAAKPKAAKKTKTATAKKAAKPKETAPSPPAASEGGDQAAPSSDAPAASGAD